MKKWMTLLAVPALCAVGLTAWAVQDDAKKAEENARVDREIKELEDQRSKIDMRLRELRRESGRVERVRPRIRVSEDIEKLSPEDREKVERALAQAQKAVEEATRNLPDFKVMIPDVQALTERILKLHKDKDGKLHGEMSAVQREQLRKEMSRMHEELSRIGPEIRARIDRDGAFKEHFKGLDKLKDLKGLKELELKGLRDFRGPEHEEIRKAMEEARREMQNAREEMRKAREEMMNELRAERERANREREKKPEKPELSSRANIDPV